MRISHCVNWLSAAALVAMAAVVYAQSNRPENLPLDVDRKVIGTWRLQELSPDCNRSIEQLNDRYFMVPRCPNRPGLDGSTGVPLFRDSTTHFRNLSGVRYEIQADGTLDVVADNVVYDRGVPQPELWPK